MNKQVGEAFAEELNTKYGGNRVRFIKCDVTSNDLESAFDEVVQEFGYIDCVINNAGLMNDHPDVYEKEMLVNVVSIRKIYDHRFFHISTTSSFGQRVYHLTFSVSVKGLYNLF